MHLIVCVDDRDGISFAGRRLSSDLVLTKYIQNLTANSKLWIAPYSASLFDTDTVRIGEDFLSQCQTGEYCFLERDMNGVPRETLESVFLCRWNRRYPATEYFRREWLMGMELVSTEDFPGNSHERITVERYMP